MPASLPPSPASFRARFAAGRLRCRDVMSIVLIGTAACGLALFSLDALLVDHPVQAEARLPAAADAFTARDLGAYVGTWTSDGGAHLIVARSGAVWSDGGGLIGAARLDPADRTRMVFESATFRCSYRIETPAPDALLWHLLEGTPGTACPTGRYTRRFAF